MDRGFRDDHAPRADGGGAGRRRGLVRSHRPLSSLGVYPGVREAPYSAATRRSRPSATLARPHRSTRIAGLFGHPCARPRRRPSHPGDGRRSYDRPGRARPGRCGARRSAHPGRAGPPRSRRASRDRGSRIDRAGRRRARPGTRSACDALIRLAGAVRNELDPDIILYVRVPNTDGIHDAALLHELSAETAAGKSVALVDLSFLSGSYEPQARFVRRLIRAGVAAKLDAYASWNTNANSTGIALAEAIAAGVGRRTGRYDPTAHADFMVDRYLDDFLYHDLVRPRLNDYLTARGVSDHTYLAPDVWADANRRLRLLLEPLAHDLIAHLYPNYRVARLSISLPWPRTFEMETDVRLTAKPS